MMRKINDLKKLITNTPLVEITYEYKEKISRVWAKCEWYSLTGSIKDKVAYCIIKNAINSNKIKPGDTIVEVTSGNMGISLCAVASYLGVKVKAIMPRDMSEERKKLLKMYGAELIEVDNFNEAFKLRDQLKNQGYFCSNQFENKDNEDAHKIFTAREILKKLRFKHPNCFVAGVGTSGTLMGVGKMLKHKIKNLQVVGVEPNNARILSNQPPFKSHKLQGLSDEILPELYDKHVVDNVIQILDDDAIAMANKLCRELSLGVGISSGANILAGILSGGNSITIFPDDNKKYLTTDLANYTETALVNEIHFLSLKVL